MKYNELTQYQKELISVNGCGGKGGWIKPPNRIFFEASCNRHDCGYGQGGCEEDRINCDIVFLKAMMRDCERITDKTRKRKYIIWSHLYFIAVRVYGWKYFNYCHQRLSIQNLLDAIERNNGKEQE